MDEVMVVANNEDEIERLISLLMMRSKTPEDKYSSRDLEEAT